MKYDTQILGMVDSWKGLDDKIVKLGVDLVKLAFVSVTIMIIMAALRGEVKADEPAKVTVAKTAVIEMLKTFNKTLKAESVCGTQGTEEFLEEIKVGNQTAWACLEMPTKASPTRLASQ